ncbi:hypothetical protein OROGR_010119 [Orobanche gracilis]
MMESRQRGRRTLLPLRHARQLSRSVSCWYCDVKFIAFNEPLFRFGRRHSRYLKVWFSIGIGFSLAALVGVTVIILYELAKTSLAYGENARSGDSLFALPLLVSKMSLPQYFVLHLDVGTLIGCFIGVTHFSSDMLGRINGMNTSPSSLAYLCLSTVVCVIVHEFGHALAAARFAEKCEDLSHNDFTVDAIYLECSEGVQVEYVAFFLAVLFPGALVAFNHAVLQALPSLASLRIYCAGIWHNAVVLDVHPVSPLSGYLSPNDVILSVDDYHIHTAEEWKQIDTVLTEQTTPLLASGGRSSEITNIRKSYCVPRSLAEGSRDVQYEGHQTYCPNELTAFASVACLDNHHGGKQKYNQKREIHCLNAKDVVKLRKCAYNSVEASRNDSGCLCSEEELCLMPLQPPGVRWVEITYSSLECLHSQRSSFSDGNRPMSTEASCLQTFVFIGDLSSISHSIRLTSYQPRLLINFIAHLPDQLEKLLTCAFHVSMVIALLNSMPVFFLDGESIMEAALVHYMGFLSRKTKRLVVRFCLVVGTLVSALFVLRIVAYIFGKLII